MSRHKGRDLAGWLVLDKPLNMGSTEAVSKVRRAFGARKAGHAGTLDPLATGVLPIAFGAATKTISYMMAADKEYIFTIGWGKQTETDDLEGAVIATSPIRPDRSVVEAVCPRFRGEIMQTPPAFSAIKVKGKRAYDLARAGLRPELKPRSVRIDALRLLELEGRNAARFHIRCGKGTYIRAIARDLARAAGTVGHVTQLRRVRVGPFHEKSAKKLAKLVNMRHSGGDLVALDRMLLPLSTALDGIPAQAVSQKQADCIRHGQAISLDTACVDGTIILTLLGDTPIAVGRLDRLQFRPFTVFGFQDLTL